MLVNQIDPLLDGGVDRAVFAAGDVGDTRGVAAQAFADVHGFWCQLILRVACLCVHLALRWGWRGGEREKSSFYFVCTAWSCSFSNHHQVAVLDRKLNSQHIYG